MKFSFYVLGKKGLSALRGFLDAFGPDAVGAVCVARDTKLESDFSTEIFELCRRHGIEIRSRGEEGPEDDATLAFAAGWRWILPRTDNLIVLHDSLLPAYRGFAPLVNMLVNGEDEIGVTAIRAVEDYDAGPVLTRRSLQVEYPLKIADAIDKVADLYGQAVVEVCQKAIAGDPLDGEDQDKSKASYSLWRDEVDYLVDWSDDAAAIRRFVDAVGPPYAGALAYAGTRAVRIFDVEEVPDIRVEARSRHLGKVVFRRAGRPVVVCGSGLIRIDRVCRDGDDRDIADELPFRTRFAAGPMKE